MLKISYLIDIVEKEIHDFIKVLESGGPLTLQKTINTFNEKVLRPSAKFATTYLISRALFDSMLFLPFPVRTIVGVASLGIDITHITSVSPEKMEKGRIRKSIDRANNYETERVDAVFASLSPIDGKNAYIARNSTGMIKLGKSTYIYGGDNIDVVLDENCKKHAITLKNLHPYAI